jgi:hypothetical protein
VERRGATDLETTSKGHIFWTLNQIKDENKTYLYSINRIHVKRITGEPYA